ncbi:hypothetical protein GQX74_013404 [Glossina fuscipes]|nr:hypothetical protein GQX74_013404 [Glossina fuscipes]
MSSLHMTVRSDDSRNMYIPVFTDNICVKLHLFAAYPDQGSASSYQMLENYEGLLNMTLIDCDIDCYRYHTTPHPAKGLHKLVLLYGYRVKLLRDVRTQREVYHQRKRASSTNPLNKVKVFFFLHKIYSNERKQKENPKISY